MFDLTSYSALKSLYFRSKDSSIARYVANRFDRDVRPKKEPLRILDVGSGDCFVVSEVVRLLRERVTTGRLGVELTCLEPSAESSKSAIGFMRHAESCGLDLDLRCQTVQNFLAKVDYRRYELILCSHVFYHIPFKDWSGVVAGLLERLVFGGQFFFIHCSRDSAPYIWGREPGDSMLEFDNWAGECGQYVFFEDIVKEVGLLRRPNGYDSVRAPIGGALAVNGALGTLESRAGLLERHGFADVLAFMLRSEKPDWQRYRNHLTATRRRVWSFESLDRTVVLRKGGR